MSNERASNTTTKSEAGQPLPQLAAAATVKEPNAATELELEIESESESESEAELLMLGTQSPGQSQINVEQAPARHVVVDLIRLGACGIVVLTHTVDSSLPAGAAVRSFFFISGYVLWRRDARNDAREFAQRVLRLYPQTALSVLFGFVVCWKIAGWNWAHVAELKNAMHLAEFTTPLYVNDVIWTIVYESFATIVTSLVRQAGTDRKLIGCMIVVCLCGYDMFIQIIIGALVKAHSLEHNRLFVSLCAFGTLLYFVSGKNRFVDFLVPFIFCAMARASIWLSFHETLSRVCRSAITQLARATFTVYLFHFPLHRLVKHLMPLPDKSLAEPYGTYGVYFSTLLIFSALFTVFVDEPIARWSKRVVQPSPQVVSATH